MVERAAAKKDVLRAGIIGCGLIGSSLDEGKQDVILTHAGAYQAIEGVELVAICDLDDQRLQRCGDRRGVDARYADHGPMLASERLDLVSICTPVSMRLPAVEAAVAAGVKVILCEKPMASSVEEARTMAELVRGSPSVLALNFLRRWDPGLCEAAQLFRSGGLGQIQRGVGFYGKGMANNGTHLVDLLNMFLGPPARVQALQTAHEAAGDELPTFDAKLDYRLAGHPASVYLLSTDHTRYSIFELDLLGTRGRLRMTEKGQRLELYGVEPDPLFDGYHHLAHQRRIETHTARLLELVVRQMVEICRGEDSTPRCGLGDGLDNLLVMDQLFESYETGRPVGD